MPAATATSAVRLTTETPAASSVHLALVPAALNPVMLRVQGHDCLIYRAMPAGWSVYFHDLRYSSQFGPVALPLMIDTTWSIRPIV